MFFLNICCTLTNRKNKKTQTQWFSEKQNKTFDMFNLLWLWGHDVVILILYCVHVLFDLPRLLMLLNTAPFFMCSRCQVMCSIPKIAIAIIITVHKHDNPQVIFILVLQAAPKYIQIWQLWYKTFSNNLMTCKKNAST